MNAAQGTSRRHFLELALLSPVLAPRNLHARTPAQIVPGLRLLPGIVNTGLFQRNGHNLLVDSGAHEAGPGGEAVDWVLVTHHHRDQAQAARALTGRSTQLAVPKAESDFFSSAEDFWRRADRVLDHQYNDFRPHLFTPRESVPVARALVGGDTFDWQDLRFEALETPGHTEGSLSYLVEVGGKRVAFVGDLIAGPGQIWEVYSLQKRFPGMRGDYWGFGGAVEQVKSSLDRLLEREPDILIPSHGVVMRDPKQAIAALKRNLDAVMDNFFTTAAWRLYWGRDLLPGGPPMFLPPLPAVGYPPWIRDVASTTKAIVSDDGSVLLSDCGHRDALKQLDNLVAEGTFKKIDAVWITHYHDDHTQTINAVRERFGSQVWVQRELVDVIENPTAYRMPCLYPKPIPVDRVLEHGKSFRWKEFTLTAFHFPGQTLYHAGLLVERDNFKAFFTGDSFANWGVDDYNSFNRCFLGDNVGYDKCFRILRATRPDILVAAHWGPQRVSTAYLQKTSALFRRRERLYRQLFPHEDPNFGTDPLWIRAYPYRQKVAPGSRVRVDAKIMNHTGAPRRVTVALALPEGWHASQGHGELTIPARQEGTIALEALAPDGPHLERAVLGLSATFGNRQLGEFAEAVVDFEGAK